MMLTIELIVLASTFIGFLTVIVGAFLLVWREVKTVHQVVNSRMDELLTLTRSASRAEGFKEGIEETPEEKAKRKRKS